MSIVSSRRGRSVACVLLVSASLAFTAGVAPVAGASPTATASPGAVSQPASFCVPDFQQLAAPTPQVPADGPALRGVAAISPTNAWAVGADRLHGEIVRWNGSAWAVASRFPQSDYLRDVSADSVNDIWVVGSGDSSPDRTLAVHWNGHRWSVVATPNVGSDTNVLTSVDAISKTDAWASGYYFNGAVEQTLVEHWDGTSWSVVPTPNVGPGDNVLNGIHALSSSDVWAVGASGNPVQATTTLAMHWDGSTWTISPTPNPGEVNSLADVALVSPGDVWAVGSWGGSSYGSILLHWNGSTWTDFGLANDDGYASVVALSAHDVWAQGRQEFAHWDGTSWTTMSAPSPGPGDVNAGGMAASAADDVWAVGQQYMPGGETGVAEHWDGSAWSLVATPVTRFKKDGELHAVAPVAQNDVWAVGDSSLLQSPLVEHYDGSAWSMVTTPTTGPNSGLFAVSGVSATSIWAGGQANGASLVEHFDGTSWTPIATPNVGRLSGIVAISDDDIWATGTQFLLHFDGVTWTSVPGAIVEQYGQFLSGIAATSSHDVWAVSTSRRIEHFDGATWSLVKMRGIGPLTAVAASSPTDVWAFGREANAAHFDGTSWIKVPIAKAKELGASAPTAGRAWAAGYVYHNRAGVQEWDGTMWTSVFKATEASKFDAVAGDSLDHVWAVGNDKLGNDNRRVLIEYAARCRVPSTITVAATPRAIAPNGAVSLSGRLALSDGASPAGQTIHLFETPPGGSQTEIGQATTDASGDYSFAPPPLSLLGTYGFAAGWDGDSDHAPTTGSTTVPVTFGRILFDHRCGTQCGAVAAVDPDGKNFTWIFANNGFRRTEASWSPDGTQIAFASKSSGNLDIDVANADGSDVRQLTTDPGTDEFPEWSPDGRSIVFDSNMNGSFDIYEIGVDGTGLIRLTDNTARDERPEFSPDGTQIAFDSNRSGNFDIWILTLGVGIRRFTTSPRSDVSPAWSPDGTKIAWTSNRSGNEDIWMQNVAGGGLTRVTTSPAADTYPTFSLDDGQIAFESSRSGVPNIWVRTLSGGTTQLTSFTGAGLEIPDWGA